MPTNFLVSSSESTSPPPSVQDLEEQPVDREPLRILVIGSRRGVTSTIQTLYRLRFAEVREWSPLMPGPNPGEVMSILTRYILTSGG
ncbi:MAG: hypothetical protein WCA35_16375 [Kovacikia sp.]